MFVLYERLATPFPDGTMRWKLASEADLLNLDPPSPDGGVDLLVHMHKGAIKHVWCFSDHDLRRLRAMPIENLLAAVEAYAILY